MTGGEETARPDRKTIVVSGRCAETIYRQRMQLIRTARDAGWTVHLMGQDSGDYADRLRAEGFGFTPVNVDQGSLNPLQLMSLVADYRRALRAIRPDVFHGFNIKPTIAGILGAKAAGVPVRIASVTGLGHVFLSSRRAVRWIAKRLFRLALGAADLTIFYNPDDCAFFLAERLVSPERIATIAGSGVDTSHFAAAPLPDKPVFRALFIGRLLEEKGVRALFEAARILRARSLPVEIALVGDVDTNNPSSLSRAEVEAEQAAGTIRWLGPSADVAVQIAEADAVVLPSYREGIPLVLLEAGAMGRPRVATDVPGCRDVIISGETGLLAPLGDPVALADAIAALAADRPAAARMGAAARRDVLERFDSAVVNRQIVSEYERLLAARTLDRKARPGT